MSTEYKLCKRTSKGKKTRQENFYILKSTGNTKYKWMLMEPMKIL